MADVSLNDLGRGFRALEADLRRAVDEVLSSGWYVLGPQHDAFEHEFAAAVGAQHCVGVGNGTDALELALLSVGCRPGDEVVTAANASMYTATAALKAGLVPRFADVDPDSLLLTAATVEPALTPRTKAVVVTHLYGRMAEIGPLRNLCRAAGIALVEDCAQAAGARNDEGPAGSLGDVAAFSFFPTKNLGALGDGGAVVTDDDERAALVRRLRQYGWSSSTPSRSRGGATAGWTNCRRPCSASSFPTSTRGTRGGARSSPAMRRSSGAGRAAWSTAVPPAPRPTSVTSP
jgi:dTDP-4-amino-4,6-dideoxygalactose transaminase